MTPTHENALGPQTEGVEITMTRSSTNHYTENITMTSNNSTRAAEPSANMFQVAYERAMKQRAMKQRGREADDLPAPTAPVVPAVASPATTGTRTAASVTDDDRLDIDPSASLDMKLAHWWATTSWDEVLSPAGWTRAGTDECGCETWTRPHEPGESVTPKSLTAHGAGCSRPRTDARHPAAHVWSDHVDDELLSAIDAAGGSRTLSAFTVFAAVQYDGDLGAAFQGAGIPHNERDLSALGASFDDSELWDAAPWLSQVRDNARRLWVDRYALLIAVLSEVALLVPPDYVMSGDGLRNVSLNTFVLLVGPPGGGKGKVLDHAQNVVKPVNTVAAVVDGPTTVKGWTGEGMGQAFHRRNDKPVGDDEPDPSVLPLSKRFREDEVANLIAKMQAKNSTIIGYANSAFFGEGMGSGLADRTQSHYVDPHTYRMSLQIAAQLGTVLPLFNDTALASGFTARLLVADTRVRRSETTSEGTVDMTPIKVDRSTIIADPLPGTAGLQAIRTDDSLLAMIAEQAGAANVLDDDADPAEVVERDDAAGHRALLQRNVATLLAIASGDELVGWDHWQFAGHVVANSQRVQRQLQVAAAKAAKAARVEAKVAESQEQAEIEQRALTDRADAVVEWARSNCPPGGVKWSALRSGKPSVGRHWSPEVHKQVRELLADGYDERVTVVEVGQGYRVELRPAG